jgi:GNAT superfamily N-acetyltransferase
VSAVGIVRPARPDDLDEILALCAEHAAFEGASFQPDQARSALERALFGEEPRARCLVAEEDATVVGYATYALEFSTWGAGEYVHMDCLFVRERHRGSGLGGLLLRGVGEVARSLGCRVEWQTPSWNEAAIRFYDRAGAASKPKIRYRWDVG